MNFQDIPARDHVASREVFQHHAARGTEFFGVELNQIPGLPNGPKTGLAHGPRPAAHLPPPRRSRRRRRFHQHTAPLQMAENPAHHGSGEAEVLARQQNGQLIFSPARIFTPQKQDRLGLRGGPGGLAPPPRTMRSILQSRQVVRIVAAPPAIKSLPANSKVAAGERRNASVLEIVSHPSQPKLACAAQLAPQARELSRSGYLSPSYLHGDTLPSVTNHSERAHSSRFACRKKDNDSQKERLEGNRHCGKGLGTAFPPRM